MLTQLGRYNIYIKMGKERGNSYQKNEEISHERHTETHGSLQESVCNTIHKVMYCVNNF